MERRFWRKTFYHISTDEVYGSSSAEGLFTETTAYDPNSPYLHPKRVQIREPTKLMVCHMLTNCSNNYGPFHFPEKLIPLFIISFKTNRCLFMVMVYPWLVICRRSCGYRFSFHKGTNHDTYNIEVLTNGKT
jgi:dTDP-glucose 4,6-dehydratase